MDLRQKALRLAGRMLEFDPDARGGVGEVWSTDCIAHQSNAIAMAPVLAEALASLG
ncbi:hypothetical protein LG290_14735 [Halomonas sediminis]